jgi:F420-non-reducing hydrogenase small subunit
MEEPKPKLKLAVYWAAACGGCGVSVLDVHEKLFDVVAAADLLFWPIALDTKYHDVENMPDNFIDLTLFNGAVRNSENEHMAKLLRAKSKILVAYGSCAHMGGIPGLANFSTRDDIVQRVFVESESVTNSDRILPLSETEIKEGTLNIPEFYNDVRSLSQVVKVDYFIPGCPPQTEGLLRFLWLLSPEPNFLRQVRSSELISKRSAMTVYGRKLKTEDYPDLPAMGRRGRRDNMFP